MNKIYANILIFFYLAIYMMNYILKNNKKCDLVSSKSHFCVDFMLFFLFSVICDIKNHTNRGGKMKVKFFLVTMVLMFGLTQCSMFNKKDDDKDKNALLALALLPTTCNLGSESFIVNGSISCTNNEASGTGTLIATSEKNLVSLQVTGTLSGSDSEITIIGAADSSLSGSGFLFGLNLAKAFHPDGTAGGVDMTSGFATTSSTFTHCVEIHTGETPPHLVAWTNNCPASGQTSADYNSEVNNNPGGALAKKGTRWGIQLKNAKISITINSDEIFTH